MKRTLDLGAPAAPTPTSAIGDASATAATSARDGSAIGDAGPRAAPGKAATASATEMLALVGHIDAPDPQMQRLFAEVIAPNAERVAAIGMRGEVVVAVHAPEGELAELATFVGWTGAQPVFRLSNAKRKVFADNIERSGDAGLARWLRRADVVRGNFRLFAISGGASLCLNFRKNLGWAIEPG